MLYRIQPVGVYELLLLVHRTQYSDITYRQPPKIQPDFSWDRCLSGTCNPPGPIDEHHVCEDTMFCDQYVLHQSCGFL